MTLKQFSYVMAISEEANIAKAAEKMYLTQSALNQQLLKLESELGAQLFLRSRGGLTLTKAGKVFLEYAKQVTTLTDEAEIAVRDAADVQRGCVSMGFASERGVNMFLAVFPVYHRLYPNIQVTPRELFGRQQFALLQSDELDVGFASMMNGDEVPGVDCTPIIQEEILLIVPLNHPLASLASPKGMPLTVLDESCLNGLPLALVNHLTTQRKFLDSMFAAHGIDPEVFLETTNNRSNVFMVENSLSSSLVPSYYIQGNDRVAVFRLKGKPVWNLSVCTRKGKYISTAVKRFINLATEYYTSLPAIP